MATYDHIFLATGLSLAEVAATMSRAVGATLEGDAARPFLRRSLSGGGDVGLHLTRNEFVTPGDPEPDEITVLDGYDISVEISIVPRNEDTLHAESRRIFEEIAASLPWPALLVLQVDLLLAAFRPGQQITWFPEGTTPDGDDAEVWAPFVIPRA